MWSNLQLILDFFTFSSNSSSLQNIDEEQFEMIECCETCAPPVVDVSSKELPLWIQNEFKNHVDIQEKEIVKSTIPDWAKNQYLWNKEAEKMLKRYEFQSLNMEIEKKIWEDIYHSEANQILNDDENCE